MGVNQIRHLLTEMRSLGQDIQGIFTCGKTEDKSWVECWPSNQSLAANNNILLQ